LEPQGSPFASGLGPFSSPSDTTQVPVLQFSSNDSSFAIAGGTRTDEPDASSSVSVFARRGHAWIRVPSPGGHRTPVDHIALSHDGAVLATASPTAKSEASAGSNIVVSDVRTGRTLKTFRAAPIGLGISLDWTRRRLVASVGLGSGDAAWYDLKR